MLRVKKLVVMLAVLAVSVCSAQAVFVDDFEAGIDNWDGASIALETTNVSPNGGSTQALLINNPNPTNGIWEGGFTTGGDQIYFPVIGGAEYTLSFDYYGINNSVYCGWYIFNADGDSVSGGGADFGWTSNAWDTYTFTRTLAADADHAYLGFFPTGPASSIIIDNVSYTPEPMTMSLLGIGGLALLRRRR